MNSDNGANVKKGLLTLSELAVTVSQEPLVVTGEGDDWSQYAINQARGEASSQAQTSAPTMNPIEDLFLPGGLEEPDWDEDFTEEVTRQYIQKLEDQFVSLMTNPRTSTMRRIACWCHTLQLPILKMLDKKNGVFKKVRYLLDVSLIFQSNPLRSWMLYSRLLPSSAEALLPNTSFMSWYNWPSSDIAQQDGGPSWP